MNPPRTGRHVDVTPPRRVGNSREGGRNRRCGRKHGALCLWAGYANAFAVSQGHSERGHGIVIVVGIVDIVTLSLLRTPTSFNKGRGVNGASDAATGRCGRPHW
jgi:hypothetical protein